MSGDKDLLKIKNEIEGAEKMLEKSWKERDFHKISSLFSPDACIMPPDSSLTFGQAGAQKALQRFRDKGNELISLTSGEIIPAGGTLVAERGSYKFSTRDRQIVETGKYVATWKREGNDLLIHYFIWNRNA